MTTRKFNQLLVSLGVTLTLLTNAYPQASRAVMVQNNTGVLLFPTNLFAANAASARSGLSLATHATNPVVPLGNGGTGATNAAGARTNLGLSWSGLTNTSAADFRLALGVSLGALTNTSNVTFLTAIGFGVTNSPSLFGLTLTNNTNSLTLSATAAVTRTNLGLGATWLTNTGITNFRRAVGIHAAWGPESVFDFLSPTSNVASGTSATISGGYLNQATGTGSTIAGGVDNEASGQESFVGGGYDNIASGSRSFAAGTTAYATNSGAFVWNDPSGGSFSSTNGNSFNVRAVGGMSLDLGNIGIIFRSSVSANATRVNLGFSTNLNTFWTATNAATARTNLSLGLPALTNTSNVTMMRALAGTTNSTEPFSGSFVFVDDAANTWSATVSNGIILSIIEQ